MFRAQERCNALFAGVEMMMRRRTASKSEREKFKRRLWVCLSSDEVRFLINALPRMSVHLVQVLGGKLGQRHDMYCMGNTVQVRQCVSGGHTGRSCDFSANHVLDHVAACHSELFGKASMEVAALLAASIAWDDAQHRAPHTVDTEGRRLKGLGPCEGS